MTWFDDVSGIETSQKRECYEFVFPSITYRICASDEDVVIDGNTYRGSPRETQITRSEIEVAQGASSARALDVTIPVRHAIAQRYLRNALPPRFLRVTVWEYQVNSGEAERQWIGDVLAAEATDHVLKLTIPSLLIEALERRLPVNLAGRQCPHVLYDAQCKVSDGSFSVATTLADIQGNVVTVASMGGNPDQWAAFGDFRHVSTDERITILSQVGNVLTLQFPLYDAADGDAVVVRAGCAHDVGTCFTKFNNKDNHGGAPSMPGENPFLLGRYGIVSQT